MNGSSLVKSISESFCWGWIGVQLPRPGNNPNSVESESFRYQDEVWFLQCDQSERDGVITLWLCHDRHGSRHSISSFGVAVTVCGYPDARPNFISSFNVCDWTNVAEQNIWQREASKIEEMIPGFSEYRTLSFKIKITDDPGLLTCACQKTKTSTHASVQTRMNACSISSLDTFSEDISRLQNSDFNPDVELHCEGCTARMHRAVLSVRSSVLATMLQADMKEGRTGIVHIRDMDTDTFQLFVNHLHNGKLDHEALNFDAALRLYQAGKMYQVNSLSSICSQILVENLKEDNAYDLLVMADAHVDSYLVEAATQYMLEKKILQPGDERWEAFCSSYQNLAIKVANRYIKELTNSSAPPRKNHCPNEIIWVE